PRSAIEIKLRFLQKDRKGQWVKENFNGLQKLKPSATCSATIARFAENGTRPIFRTPIRLFWRWVAAAESIRRTWDKRFRTRISSELTSRARDYGAEPKLPLRKGRKTSPSYAFGLRPLRTSLLRVKFPAFGSPSPIRSLR